MVLTKQEIKKRYFDKTYQRANIIKCKCGCGRELKDKDKYGRNVFFINGHNNKKYQDTTQYKREWNHRNRKQRKEYISKFLNDFKSELVIKAGGKCMDCQYLFDGTNNRAFDFHHRNPDDKEICVNKGTMNRVSKEKIRREVTKCDILCARCHRLRH